MKGVKHSPSPNRLNIESDSNRRMDPLYVIFEEHLYNFKDSDVDQQTFISQVIKEYIVYLRKHNILIPKPLEEATWEELTHQLTAMLLKKVYGRLTIQEFRESLTPAAKKEARKQVKLKLSRLK